MARIAKKSRSVKGVNKPKPSWTEPRKPKKKQAAPRYTIRKDSLDRRYAIDKRTGKRVSVFKATQERTRRRKAAAKEVFRGIPKTAKSKLTRVSTHKKRSEASKRGWKTRRAKAIERPDLGYIAPPPSIPIEGLIPKGLKVHILGGIADRSEIYPKVGKAAYKAWLVLQLGKVELEEAIELKLNPPDIITPRFDRLYGKGHGAFVLNNFYYHASDLEDVDQMVETLNEMEDNDYSIRELYTLYFSPELA